MTKRTLISTLTLVAAALLTSGCFGIAVNTKATKTPDGFVFGSADGGVTWKQAAILLRPGANALSLANATVTTLVVDPTDPNALYAGTPDRGLFYSFTGGRDWQATLENQGAITAVAVDPLNHCVLYVAIASTLQKSVDCGRNWQRLVVTSGKTTNTITAIVVDNQTSGHVLVGTGIGELHRSNDGGDSWALIYKFKRSVTRMILNPNDASIIYAAINGEALYRSTDSGATWENVSPRDPNDLKLVRLIKGVSAYRDLAIDYTVSDGIFLASDAGLYHSDDGGVSWSSTTMPVTLERGVRLGQLVVDSDNNNHIFLSVGKRLASTENGGETWTWHDLPSARPLVEMVRPPNKSYLFAGFGAVAQ